MATVEYFPKVIHELYIKTGVTSQIGLRVVNARCRTSPFAGKGGGVCCSLFFISVTYVYESLSMLAVVMHNMNQ
jgi:hypothetical protein